MHNFLMFTFASRVPNKQKWVPWTLQYHLCHLSATPKKRFQFISSSSKQKAAADEFPMQLKDLHQVINFSSPGTFFVRAIIANVQYCLYQACPLKTNGLPCKKKLTDDLYCGSCDHHATKPIHNLYLRIDLRDCDDAETSKQITAFSTTAEQYLGLKVAEFLSLAEQRPKKLASILEAKIDQTVSVKLIIKAKGETLDWVIGSIIVPEKKNGDVNAEANKKGAVKDDSDDDDIYTFDDDECTPMPKRPKKNTE